MLTSFSAKILSFKLELEEKRKKKQFDTLKTVTY